MSAVPKRSDDAIARLSALLGERLTTSTAERERHARDESYHRGPLPDAIAYAHTTEEVQAIVRICAETGTPIVPFGVGTSLEGHIIAVRGGIVLDLSQMNRILAVRAEDMDATVEPGVTRKQLNEALRDTGLFFAVDPGADATLGGMAATRASGTNAVRYGTMRETVLNLKVVTADGNVVKCGGRARKSAAGYDLTRLFVGSEGTLGIITELSVRLHGVPEEIASAVCSFDTLDGAVAAVIETIQSGIPMARIELLDEVQIDAVNRYSKLDLPVGPNLFLEFHGTKASVAEQTAMVGGIFAEHGGHGFAWATALEERNKLWTARHNAYYAAKALRPGAFGWPTDVCVPISALAQCIAETKADLVESGALAPLVGHVGDGNFHLVFLFDPDNADERKQVETLNGRLVRRALAMGGTATGEHGVGLGKKAYLVAEHGPEAVALMRTLKRALDPQDILNPGKIF
ncbi:FAD-binding oxidoreductase [Zavarzinia sp. CC-PAN008]|uniref:FAD-binding oxidoreductase n=1 Tax=Zavarzinia sp. CC-PAN008 TaxID=3243332 RepID=UPI003F749118